MAVIYKGKTQVGVLNKIAVVGLDEHTEVYSKTETDTLLDKKADSTEVYTKYESYNKTETDTLLDKKENLNEYNIGYVRESTYFHRIMYITGERTWTSVSAIYDVYQIGYDYNAGGYLGTISINVKYQGVEPYIDSQHVEWITRHSAEMNKLEFYYNIINNKDVEIFMKNASWDNTFVLKEKYKFEGGNSKIEHLNESNITLPSGYQTAGNAPLYDNVTNFKFVGYYDSTWFELLKFSSLSTFLLFIPYCDTTPTIRFYPTTEVNQLGYGLHLVTITDYDCRVVELAVDNQICITHGYTATGATVYTGDNGRVFVYRMSV